MILARSLNTGRLASALGTLALVALGGIVCFLVGALVALGALQIDLLLVGLVTGAFLLVFSLALSFWALALLTLVISGVAEYFFRVSQAQWIPYLVAMFLYVKLLLDSALSVKGHFSGTVKPRMPAFVWLGIAYLAVIGVSFAVNVPPLAQALVGAKNYVPFWSVLFALAAGALAPYAIAHVWWALVAIAVIQLPFVLYQNVVVMRGRGDIWAYDSVVGTFGGNPMGGGSNSALALFMLAVLVFAAALWRRGALATRWLIALSAIAAAVIALGETKIVVILIPCAAVMLFWDRIRSSSFAAAGTALGLAVVLGGLLLLYQAAFWSWSLRTKSVVESVEKSVGYIVDPYNINPTTGEVGRMASLKLWWSDSTADLSTRTIGYGAGASRSRSTVAIGEVAKRFIPLDIGATAAAVLLWDVGVVGFALFVGVLAFAAVRGLRIAGADEIPVFHRACLQASSIVLAMMLVMVPYNRYVVDQASVQLLMMFCLGQIAFWHRYRLASTMAQRRAQLLSTRAFTRI